MSDMILNYHLMHPGGDSVPAKIRKVEIWKLEPANQGFLEARENRIWEPSTQQ